MIQIRNYNSVLESGILIMLEPFNMAVPNRRHPGFSNPNFNNNDNKRLNGNLTTTQLVDEIHELRITVFLERNRTVNAPTSWAENVSNQA